jgi:hypothetical protein
MTISFSESLQDRAAAAVLDKTGGTFLDIGCAHPTASNNTYLLEKEYNFRGVSIDMHDWSSDWFVNRFGSVFLNCDALAMDYGLLLRNQERIDYLSIDIDPGKQSLAVLHKLLHNNTRFTFITFEYETSDIQPMAQSLMSAFGYELLFDCMAAANDDGTLSAFEDWYVDSSVIDPAIKNKYKLVDGIPKLPQEFFKTRN